MPVTPCSSGNAWSSTGVRTGLALMLPPSERCSIVCRPLDRTGILMLLVRSVSDGRALRLQKRASWPRDWAERQAARQRRGGIACRPVTKSPSLPIDAGRTPILSNYSASVARESLILAPPATTLSLTNAWRAQRQRDDALCVLSTLPFFAVCLSSACCSLHVLTCLSVAPALRRPSSRIAVLVDCVTREQHPSATRSILHSSGSVSSYQKPAHWSRASATAPQSLFHHRRKQFDLDCPRPRATSFSFPPSTTTRFGPKHHHCLRLVCRFKRDPTWYRAACHWSRQLFDIEREPPPAWDFPGPIHPASLTSASYPSMLYAPLTSTLAARPAGHSC